MAGYFALLLLPVGVFAQADEPRVLEYGFEQRVRNENWNNLYDFSDAADDQRVQVRYRTRAWAKVPLITNVAVFVGVNSETNHVVVQRCPWRFDEVVFESAYIDFKKIFVKGLSLRAGRQTLIKGDGFLIIDGSPYDGSRTQYVNALDLAYAWKRSKLEALAISDPTTDRYLPVLHERRTLLDWNDRAYGAYYTDENLKNTTLESYYFHKTETGDPRAASHPQYQPNRYVHTAGGHVSRSFRKNWTLSAEAAQQWGHQHPDTPIKAWGSNLYLRRTFDRPSKPYLQFGQVAFSGDDAATASVEGWDPLFARWPKWSELYLYSLWREHGLGYWSNMRSWQAEAGYSPAKNLKCRFTWYRSTAFHPNLAGDRKIFSTSGTNRGDNYQVRADLRISPQWNTHVVYESFLPGSFYVHDSPAYFLRFEVMWTYKGQISGSRAARHSRQSPTPRG